MTPRVMRQKLERLRGTMHKMAVKIATERTTPARVGAAVAVGVFVGVSPFYGLHLAMCLVLATLLGLNRVITYLAAHVSVPWIAPFLIFATVQCGSFLLTGGFLKLTINDLGHIDPWDFGKAWLLGWLALGTCLGLVLGALAWALTKRYRKTHPLAQDPWQNALEATATLYLPQGRMAHGFVRGKLTHDPVFRQLLEKQPWPSPVVDIGCGRGQGLLLLAHQDPTLHGTGLDWDAPKIALAQAAATPMSQRLQFGVQDIRTCAYPTASTVLMLDVLHYNPVATQDAMLQRAAQSLLPNGTLYVRELDAAQGLRAKINMWQERLGCALRLNRGATLVFRPAKELVQVLEAEGLVVSVQASFGELPLANVLLVAKKP